jgi:hypothetical protein
MGNNNVKTNTYDNDKPSTYDYDKPSPYTFDRPNEYDYDEPNPNDDVNSNIYDGNKPNMEIVIRENISSFINDEINSCYENIQVHKDINNLIITNSSHTSIIIPQYINKLERVIIYTFDSMLNRPRNTNGITYICCDQIQYIEQFSLIIGGNIIENISMNNNLDHYYFAKNIYTKMFNIDDRYIPNNIIPFYLNYMGIIIPLYHFITLEVKIKKDAPLDIQFNITYNLFTHTYDHQRSSLMLPMCEIVKFNQSIHLNARKLNELTIRDYQLLALHSKIMPDKLSIKCMRSRREISGDLNNIDDRYIKHIYLQKQMYNNQIAIPAKYNYNILIAIWILDKKTIADLVYHTVLNYIINNEIRSASCYINDRLFTAYHTIIVNRNEFSDDLCGIMYKHCVYHAGLFSLM